MPVRCLAPVASCTRRPIPRLLRAAVLVAAFVSAAVNALCAPARLEQVAPGVYLFKDTCNVYAVVKDRKALLIDFGSGEILDQLRAAGVGDVQWILHTHFHRDQMQGDALAKARGIKIAVPASERKYFQNAEQFWNDKKVFVLYDLRNEFMAPRQNVDIDRSLKPGETFSWNGIELMVFATPGHTEGSLSFLYETGGQRLLFCGDLVASRGKIPTVHDLEWPYVGTNGIDAEMRSLELVARDLYPDLVLPSHGSPSSDPVEWLPALLVHLSRIYHRYDWFRDVEWRTFRGPARVSKHIWQFRQFGMSGVGYVIVSDTGHAALWDMNAGEVDYLAEFQKLAGFKAVDFIAASHYHDDHVGGVNVLKKRYGAQFWAMDHMVDVLQNPVAYNLPCLWPEPMRIDRVLHDGERIVWEGIPLQFFYLPGQTEYTEGLLIEDGGKRYLFDGDNVARPLPGTPLLGHFVCRNYQRLDGGHLYSARKLLELKPDYICPNHFDCSEATPELLESYLRSSEEMGDDFRAIIDQPDAEFGVDNNWASLYPYQAEAVPGGKLPYELRIRNWLSQPSLLKATIRLPEGWTAAPADLALNVPPRAQSAARFVVQVPSAENRTNRRFVITADLWRDGEHLGEMTEMLINMGPMKAH